MQKNIKKIIKNSSILFFSLVFLILISGIVIAAEKPSEEFPSRSIKIIVPFNVGGATDTLWRTLSKPMSDILGVEIKIVNIVGGMDIPAFNALMEEPADGYTMLTIGDGDIINSVYGRYDYTELMPIARAQADQSVIWIPAESKFKDFGELIDDAKKNPGKQRWCGGRGYDEIFVAILSEKAGIEVVYSPFKSCNDANAQLAGGHYDAGHEEFGPMMSLFNAGKVLPVVVTTEERLPDYPDVPTARDYGIDLVMGRWRGIAVKKGTPSERIKILEEAVKKARQTEIYQKFEKQTVTDQQPGFLGSKETLKLMDENYKMYSRVMKKLGLVD